MTLQDFVSESLKSIINGVIDAQDYAKEKGAIVNPTRDPITLKSEKMWMWRGQGKDGMRPVTKINFDVAVVIGTEENNHVGGGIAIQVFKLSGQSKSLDTNTTTSRISFDIDVALPEYVNQ